MRKNMYKNSIKISDVAAGHVQGIAIDKKREYIHKKNIFKICFLLCYLTLLLYSLKYHKK